MYQRNFQSCLRNLFHSFWFKHLRIIFQVGHLQFIWKLAINIHHCSFGCYVFHPTKKKTKTETKRNKSLQDFSRSEYISFTILIVTLNIIKSDFTSFIEANIYMQTGEHSGMRVICDYCKTQQNPSLEGGSWARQCSLPHNIALTSIHACLLKAC